LRDVGDDLPARRGKPGVGILIAGNERVTQIFRDLPGMYMEKWRGRISGSELRISGPSIEEAKEMIVKELGPLKAAAIDLLLYGRDKMTANVVNDPISKQNYVTMHGLFIAIRKLQKRQSSKAN